MSHGAFPSNSWSPADTSHWTASPSGAATDPNSPHFANASGEDAASVLHQQSSAADGTAAAPNAGLPPLRRGKWSPEEEEYAERLIQEFLAGTLPLLEGTTLRVFLSQLLHCDPMRISKKFANTNSIGKLKFQRASADQFTDEQLRQKRVEMCELERRYLLRVAQNQRIETSSSYHHEDGGAQPLEPVDRYGSLRHQMVQPHSPPGYPPLLEQQAMMGPHQDHFRQPYQRDHFHQEDHRYMRRYDVESTSPEETSWQYRPLGSPVYSREDESSMDEDGGEYEYWMLDGQSSQSMFYAVQPHSNARRPHYEMGPPPGYPGAYGPHEGMYPPSPKADFSHHADHQSDGMMSADWSMRQGPHESATSLSMASSDHHKWARDDMSQEGRPSGGMDLHPGYQLEKQVSADTGMSLRRLGPAPEGLHGAHIPPWTGRQQAQYKGAPRRNCSRDSIKIPQDNSLPRSDISDEGDDNRPEWSDHQPYEQSIAPPMLRGNRADDTAHRSDSLSSAIYSNMATSHQQHINRAGYGQNRPTIDHTPQEEIIPTRRGTAGGRVEGSSTVRQHVPTRNRAANPTNNNEHEPKDDLSDSKRNASATAIAMEQTRAAAVKLRKGWSK